MSTGSFDCAYCGEPNETFVDLTGGFTQSYTEDCQVCCRPNVLFISIDEETLEVRIDTEFEG